MPRLMLDDSLFKESATLRRICPIYDADVARVSAGAEVLGRCSPRRSTTRVANVTSHRHRVAMCRT